MPVVAPVAPAARTAPAAVAVPLPPSLGNDDSDDSDDDMVDGVLDASALRNCLLGITPKPDPTPAWAEPSQPEPQLEAEPVARVVNPTSNGSDGGLLGGATAQLAEVRAT